MWTSDRSPPTPSCKSSAQGSTGPFPALTRGMRVRSDPRRASTPHGNRLTRIVVRAGAAAGIRAPPVEPSHATKATATSVRLPLAKEAILSPRKAQQQFLRQEATAPTPSNVQEPSPASTPLPTETPPSSPPPDETPATSQRPSAPVYPVQQPPPPPLKAAPAPVNCITAPLVAVVLECTATGVQVVLDFHPGIPGTLKPPVIHVSCMGRPAPESRFDHVAAI